MQIKSKFPTNSFLWILVFLSFALSVNDHAAYGDDSGQGSDYSTVFDQLANLMPDYNCAKVGQYTLKRDAIQFLFEEGTICSSRPIGGRIWAVIFNGKGRFSFKPATDIERKQLARFYETETIDYAFSSAVFYFADRTYDSLRASLDFVKEHPNTNQVDILNDATEYLAWKKERYCDPHLLKSMLDDATNAFFWAMVVTDKHGKIFYQFDPFDSEEVSLSREVTTFGARKSYETICQFSSLRESQRATSEDAKTRQPVTIVAYQLECAIEHNLHMRVKATVKFRSQLDGQRWLAFDLAEPMELDSACWIDGGRISAYKKKDNPTLWIKCPKPIVNGEQCSVTAYYQGNAIERQYNWFYVKSDISWYPTTDYWERAQYDVTFYSGKEYNLVTSFKPVSTTAAGDSVITRIVTEEPYRNFGFNLGYFKKYEINDPSIPPIEILYADLAHRDIKMAALERGNLSLLGTKMEKNVGADIANSMAFCQQLFGPCRQKSLSVAEFPYGGGVAYPGMINLSWSTFLPEDWRGFDEMLRAHEVSHQWWGVDVDFETYHDHWLCEGLATFTGLLYMQKALKDNKKYFDVLDDWKDELLNVRKTLFFSGKEPGPIWLGKRNNTSETKNDFDLVVYSKGAWVFHMLRNMMIDLNTMNEDAFISLLRDFHECYSGKYASTDDFQTLAERCYGQKLDWFFDEWVRGTAIPRYKYAFRSQAEGGKIKTVVRVRQDGVPDDFKMVVPIELDFGDKRYARLRITVQGPLSEIELPLLPAPPKKINFNIFQSVLCTSNEVDWKSLDL